jgi:hypothetical protein
MTIRKPKGPPRMPAISLEHVNLTVADPARSAQLMIGLFDWHIRWSGPSQYGGNTIHVGDERFYIAFYGAPDGYRGPWAKGVPLNDLDAIERRVIAAGLTPFAHGDYEPGRRFYFFDFDGIEFEIVSYA